jgi:hypothetical protein
MQFFVRGTCTMIDAAVQRDVDGIPEGSHYVLRKRANLLLDGNFFSKPGILKEAFNKRAIHPIWRRDAHSSWGINASRIRQSDVSKPEESKSVNTTWYS